MSSWRVMVGAVDPEDAMSAETHLSEMEEELAQAVASEDYETAAWLRDQIELVRREVRVIGPPGDAPQAAYYMRRH